MTTAEEPHRMKWTLNTVWYLIQPIFKFFHVTVTREWVKKVIRIVCEDKGITRESLGIFAGVRAELYFKGWSSVSFDSIASLAEKGTDIVFVEKEGIPEVLTDFADKYGIAMVNTRGHLTEYGKDLMKVAKASGAHVVIMTDYDATGVKIASESPTEMPWIGANDAMLEYFNLSRDSSIVIDSETEQNKRYIRHLVETGRHDDGRIDTRFKNVDVDFLDGADPNFRMGERVELDAILAKVGDERFFQYILDTLEEIYPTRDYNRAIEIETDELGAGHEEALELIDNTVKEVVNDEAEIVKEELKTVKGFIDVNEKLKDIKERLRKTLTDDPDYEDFTNKLNDLVESHPFFTKNKGKGTDKGTDNKDKGTDKGTDQS